jgi:type II secretory pathway pseudopilin PulG
MQKNLRSRNFGVLEIIVSVALLAGFSVFILRLFVAASDKQKQAMLMDTGVQKAVTLVEEFKGDDKPYDLLTQLKLNPSVSGAQKVTEGMENGLQAVVEIKKDSENTAGSVYIVIVDIQQSKNSESVYKLSGTKYFAGQK